VKRINPGWLVAFVLAVVVVAFCHQGTLRKLPETGDDELPTIARVRDLITDEWVEEPTSERRERMRYGAVEGMAQQLDPYSEFIPPEKKDRFDEETNGEFGGLGILIDLDRGQVVVSAPMEGTPAWEAGVLPGDRVVEIDGARYEFASKDEATKKLRGPIGTTIELLVENVRRPAPAKLCIKRAVITMQSVKGVRLISPTAERPGAGASRIGHLRITGFQEPTLDEFDRAIAHLGSAGPLSGLVIDLRGNPGGFLTTATDIASRFLDKGATVVITKSRGGKNEAKTLADPPRDAPTIRVPTAILIDGGSASASEVLAGALRDNGRASLVGMRSFGKGSVQSIFQIDDGKAKLKLTTHHYCTPSGRRIHRLEGMTDKDEWGLLPDIAVPIEAKARQDLMRQEYELDLDELKAKRDPLHVPIDQKRLLRDPQLEAALDHVLQVIRNESKLAQPQPRSQPLPSDVATVNTLGAPKKEPRSPGGG
jgi:carboxyl-terminal processing protease